MRMVLAGLLGLAFCVVAVRTSSAQDAAPEQVVVETNAATPQAPSQPPYPVEAASDVRRLNAQERDMMARSKRTRTALIATSAITAVGITLVAVGSTQCSTETRVGEDDFDCNRAGDALLATGAVFTVSGAVGMLVSGIMLGVRNGKLRRFRHSRLDSSDAAVRWDPHRLAWVF